MTIRVIAVYVCDMKKKPGKKLRIIKELSQPAGWLR
jgi:hypothetical protein